MQDGSLSEEEKRSRASEVLRTTFKPEFLNRIDDIITFRSLERSDIDRIIGIQIALLSRRLAERKLSLELTPKAKTVIADAGYSPVYGARPLKRALQKLILDPLAFRILDGEFAEGDTVVADLGKGSEITLKKKKK